MEPRGATTPITAGELDSLVEAAAREGGDLQQLRAAAKRVEAAAVVADERRRSAEAGLGAGGAQEGDYAELDAALDRALSDFASDDEELAFSESCDVSVDIGAGVRRNSDGRAQRRTHQPRPGQPPQDPMARDGAEAARASVLLFSLAKPTTDDASA